MLDLSVFRVVAYQIVVLVVPHQRPGADLIPGAVLAQLHFLIYVPPEIFEPDLAVRPDGLVQLVYIIVDAFVHGLDAPGNNDLPLEFPGLILAHHAFQFFYQRVGFFVRDELGRLHGVHQQFQLGQFKPAVAHMVIKIPPGLLADNIKTEITQQLEILIQRLPLRAYPVGVQFFRNLGKGKGVLVIRIFGKYFYEVQQFQLLFISRHRYPPVTPSGKR